MRIFSFYLACWFCSLLFSPGCTTVPSPPPPELGDSEREAKLRLQSIQAAEETIEREILRLDELVLSFQAQRELLLETDLPLARLRLVSMNCLNTEYGDGLSTVIGLEGTPISCRPEHLQTLQDSLAEYSVTSRDQALQFLYIIDQVRILRGALRQRLTRLPETIADHQDFIVEERANLRRIEADLARRRSLYSSADWADVMTLIGTQRVLLREFEGQLDQLAELYPQWPAILEEKVALVYFELSELQAAESW